MGSPKDGNPAYYPLLTHLKIHSENATIYLSTTSTQCTWYTQNHSTKPLNALKPSISFNYFFPHHEWLIHYHMNRIQFNNIIVIVRFPHHRRHICKLVEWKIKKINKIKLARNKTEMKWKIFNKSHNKIVWINYI